MAAVLLLLLVASAPLRVACSTVARTKDCSLEQASPWAAAARTSASQLSSSNAATSRTAYVVETWGQGRFGNHFIIVRNAVKYAICCGASLQLPAEDTLPLLKRFLDFSSFPGGNATASCGPGHTGSGTDFFFWKRNMTGLPLSPRVSCDADLYSALQFILFNNSQPHGCHSIGDHCPAEIDSNTLVVSIRSGDIFHSGYVNPRNLVHYKQPPVVFYESVFRVRNWSQILLVTSVESAFLNPVWTYYLDPVHWPPSPMTFQACRNVLTNALLRSRSQMSTNFEADLRILLCARFFVAATSSLSTFVLETAPYLEESFVFGLCDHVSHLYSSCVSYESTTYRNGDWDNSPAQRQAMLDPHELIITTQTRTG